MIRSGWPVAKCLLVLAFGLAAVNAGAAEQKLLGQYGGRCNGVAVQGNHAYVLEGNSLVTLDVTSATAPRVTSRRSLPDFPNNIKLSGNKLVVLIYPWFQIYDITQPALPVLKWEGKNVPCYGNYYDQTLALSGDLLVHAADENHLINVMDLSDPANPAQRGKFNDFPGYYVMIDAILVSGERAYITYREENKRTHLDVLDLSNPDAPSRLLTTTVPTRGTYTDPILTLGIHNNFLYGLGGSGIYCYDITLPTSPTLVNTLPNTEFSKQILFNGDIAYVLDTYHEMCGDLIDSSFRVMDFTDPLHPELKSLDNKIRTYQVANIGSRVFQADQRDGLVLLDAANPTQPVKTPVLQTLYEARAVALSGRRAYVRNRDELRVLDVADPASITQTGSVTVPGLFGPLQSRGTFLYNLNTTSGLSIIDATQPDAPALRSRLKTPGAALDLWLDGRYAYIADGDRLQIADVADPASPRLLALTGDVMRAQKRYLGVAVQNGTAYVSDEETGLTIYDVHTPTSPRLLNRFPIAIKGWLDVAVWRNWILIGSHEGNLAMVDASDPQNPILVRRPGSSGSIGQADWQSNALFTENAQLWMIDKYSGFPGLGAFDLHALNPLNDIFWFSGPTAHDSYVSDFKVMDGIDVIANGRDGLYIYQVKNPYNAAQPVWAEYP